MSGALGGSGKFYFLVISERRRAALLRQSLCYVEDLLPVCEKRVVGILDRAGYETIGAVFSVSRSDLLKIRGIGAGGVDALIDALESLGLYSKEREVEVREAARCRRAAFLTDTRKMIRET